MGAEGLDGGVSWNDIRWIEELSAGMGVALLALFGLWMVTCSLP